MLFFVFHFITVSVFEFQLWPMKARKKPLRRRAVERQVLIYRLQVHSCSMHVVDQVRDCSGCVYRLQVYSCGMHAIDQVRDCSGCVYGLLGFFLDFIGHTCSKQRFMQLKTLLSWYACRTTLHRYSLLLHRVVSSACESTGNSAHRQDEGTHNE